MYGVMAANQGKEFFPFVFVAETFGGLGRDALRLLDLVSMEGLFFGSSARMTKAQFRRWLLVDWQRHNARIIVDSFDKNYILEIGIMINL